MVSGAWEVLRSSSLCIQRPTDGEPTLVERAQERKVFCVFTPEETILALLIYGWKRESRQQHYSASQGLMFHSIQGLGKILQLHCSVDQRGHQAAGYQIHGIEQIAERAPD